jgi:heme-degrading monooxygenase HmoA
MFARAARFQYAPESFDKRLADYPTTMSAYDAFEGYLGSAVLVDRDTNTGISVTYWATAEAMQASEDVGASIRGQAAAEGLRLVDVDRMELVIVERARPPQSGTFIRTIDAHISAGKIETMLSLARDRALPMLKQQPGFIANLVGVNRETGRIVTSSVWESAQAREASDAALQGMRAELAQLVAAPDVKVELWEGVYSSIKVPTTA